MRKIKESGIKFVGDIPENWKISKNKYCFELDKNIVGESFEEYKLLSLTKNGIIYKDINNTFGKIPESYETYQSVKNGQMVMCLFDLDISAVFSGLSNYDGMISPAYKVYNCKNNILNKYASYWFDFCFDGRKYMTYSKSLRYVVNTEDFKEIEIILPPIQEQQKIVEFLDKRIEKINKIMGIIKDTIEAYKKFRQLIIDNCVTKGLNKNIDFINSGLEWIGDMPKNWDTIKIKYTSWLKGRIGWQGLTSNEYIEKGPYLITGTDFKNGIIDWNSCVHISKERFVEDTDIHIKENDLLITKDGTVGKVAIAKNCPKEVSLNSGVLLIRNTKKYEYNEKYLYYILLSKQFTRWYQLSQTGNSTIKHLYQEQFYNFEFTYPPMDEQIEICNYLDRKVEQINKLIEIKEKTLEELSNYKKSLIYEYVTGKKEVKENQSSNRNNIKGIKVNCKDNIFAQAILLCRIIEKLNNYNLGRVKAEKTLYLIEKNVGFDFDNNYVREAAGPLSEAIYKCEAIISTRNKWVNVKKVRKHIEYEMLSSFNKYSQYYDKYYSDYDKRIENIINIVKDYSTDKAEMVATLYASWNDFIIKKEKVSDIKIVKDVRENWNDTKKRFEEKKWLDVLGEMKQIGLIPKGNGNLTIIKEQ